MNSQLIELLLYSLILSLYINALHIMFQKEMFLNWHHLSIYNWLESKFRNSANKQVCDLDYEFLDFEKEGEKRYIAYNKEYGITKKWKFIVDSKEKAEYTTDSYKIPYNHVIESSKWRNSEGLLYIAKPIYSCASCMPSIHSLPLLLILPLWKVAIIAVISVTISTLINDKLFSQ